ncbi:alpha-glucan family phosphorylase [Kaarinaea lacus]
MTSTKFSIEVRPQIPAQLAALEEMANDLLYSWDRGVRGLFYRLDPQLWESCNHNPKVFLRRVSQITLEHAAEDHVFLEEFTRVTSVYRSYHEKPLHEDFDGHLDPEKDLIAYFCAEFGLHESFPIYSGGLGILAGDHCKAASDMRLPFVGIGLLYRQGYFIQTIDGSGQQMAQYQSIDFNDLLIQPAKDASGKEVIVSVNIKDREVSLRVWEAKAGHIKLYLLDSDLEENGEVDRSITFQLYGGDKTTRMTQEIVLGIGGVRALRAMGLEPTVWHINEGHAAFQIVERCRELVEKGMDFDSALEQVAAGTVYTTHTPVPAGHDIFEPGLMTQYFSNFIKQLDTNMEQFLQLGQSAANHGSFNMTALALRGSRFHNGVSRIHGRVASKMEGYIWPQIPAEENPIKYVTNGVHIPTFMAREWVNLFDMRFREWRNRFTDENYWSYRLDEIPDHRFWSLRQELKTQLMEDVCDRTLRRFHRTGHSEAMVRRITQFASKPERNTLVIGFARRFATYKRATLLFRDPDRLSRLLNDPERPVILIFAGKAHPNDIPGQDLIRAIHDYSLKPEFIGKIILLESYDIALARKLVMGVDVWLNTPEYPLEASGTSGQKAALNGVVNLSVLDGWWGEGYNGKNGWAIHPQSESHDIGTHDAEESFDLFNILEREIIPMYFDTGMHGYSKEWVKVSKESMKTCIPKFNAQRMVCDYVTKYYIPARDQYRRFSENNSQVAKSLSEWKKKINLHWDGVTIKCTGEYKAFIDQGETLPITINANLNGLSESDVAVECLVGEEDENGDFLVRNRQRFEFVECKGKNHLFELKMKPGLTGLCYFKLRIYPYHESLSHPFETGKMLWI